MTVPMSVPIIGPGGLTPALVHPDWGNQPPLHTPEWPSVAPIPTPTSFAVREIAPSVFRFDVAHGSGITAVMVTRDDLVTIANMLYETATGLRIPPAGGSFS